MKECVVQLGITRIISMVKINNNIQSSSDVRIIRNERKAGHPRTEKSLHLCLRNCRLINLVLPSMFSFVNATLQ